MVDEVVEHVLQYAHVQVLVVLFSCIDPLMVKVPLKKEKTNVDIWLIVTLHN